MGAPRLAAVIAAVAIVSACGTDESSGGASSSTGGTAGHAHAGAAGSTNVGGAGGTAGTTAAAGNTGTGATAGSAGAASVVCDLGTMYPGVALIDPDAPVFQDGTWSQQQVVDAFAQAKTDNSTAYLGYKAARDYSQHLDCAFCACGCEGSIGHLSAIDCFKDMHGFT